MPPKPKPKPTFSLRVQGRISLKGSTILPARNQKRHPDYSPLVHSERTRVKEHKPDEAFHFSFRGAL